MDTQKIIKLGALAGAGYTGWKYLDTKYKVADDLSLIYKLAFLKKRVGDARANNLNYIDIWYETSNKLKNKTSIIFNDVAYSFGELEALSNKVSQWLMSKGIKRGDTVALLMENRPEFLMYELGIAKLGVKVAFINTSIKQKGLVHCVKISECKMLIFGSELQESLSEVQTELEASGIFLYCDGEDCGFTAHANPEISPNPTEKPDPKLREGITLDDTFGFIYTSGTTGLPKAAIILHQKMLMFGGLMQFGFGVKESDVVYTTLPLFHSAGGGLGIGMMIGTGATLVIKKKFSASEFWKDCVKYDVTVTQYIGELCRYLILQPVTEFEKKHHLRIAIGNGLRPEIWDEFQERFNIPEIGEFYGATEGNGALINHCTKKEHRGACGRAGALVRMIQGVKFAKFDVLNEEPLRDPNTGLCAECGYNEPGELLFVIKDSDPGTKFVGYKNKKATEKKILTDAFKKGDKYFRTGDLLAIDEKGMIRFVDRIGDTFRWKGENCSTTEVTEVVGTFSGIEEVNVYGVQIPNNMDGRAPTAGITPVDGNMSNLDLKGLAEHVKKNLPSYAVPMFLRILPQMEVTATMKHQKVKLRTEGIELDKVSDPLFWLNPRTKEYEPFGEAEFKEVAGLKAKL